MGPDRRDSHGPSRSRYSDRGGGQRMVPYQPRKIKGPATRRCYVNNLPWDLKWQDFKDHMKQAGVVTFVELFEDPNGRSLGCGLVEFSSVDEVKKAIDTLNDSKLNGREIKVKRDEVRFYPKVPDMCGPSPNMDYGPPPGPPSPLPPYNRPPEPYNRQPEPYNRQPEPYNRQPEPYNRQPEPYNRQQEPYNRQSEPYNRQPEPYNRQPEPYNRQPEPYNRNSEPISNTVFITNISYDLTPKHLRDTFRNCGEILRVNIERDKDGKSKGFGTIAFKYPEMALRAIDDFNGRTLKGRQIGVRMDKITAVQMPTNHHDRPHAVDHGPNHGNHSNPGNHGSGLPNPGSQQAQLLQSIGLAAITSMLGSGNNNVLSGIMNQAGITGDRNLQGGGPGSSLENLLGRDTIEGLLQTQNVGSSGNNSGNSGNNIGAGNYGNNAGGCQPFDNRDNSRDYNRDNRRNDYPPDRYNPEPRMQGNMNRYHDNGPGNKYRNQGASKVFVRNIPYNIGNQQLCDFFRHAGHILDCNIMTDAKGGSRGCALLKFESDADADRAINMFHRSHLQGREIEVRIDN